MCFEKNEVMIKEPPLVKKLVKTIRDNIPSALEMKGSKENIIEFAIIENVKNIAANISEEHAIISRIAEGRTVIKQALYSSESGKVSWL